MCALVCALCWREARIVHAIGEPSAEQPLVIHTEAKEVAIFGRVYAQRFNTAQGEEAHYHLLVWNKGTSPTALIETPVDDLVLHAELLKLGAKPGDNLTMASWTKRSDEQNEAPREKVMGSELAIRIAWQEKPEGIPATDIFSQPLTLDPRLQTSYPQPPASSPQPLVFWRFGGNRDRLFNKIPFGPRPGCLVCLYSCPSGKVSNAALSVHDYVSAPARFVANTALLPPDGTPVIITFQLMLEDNSSKR